MQNTYIYIAATTITKDKVIRVNPSGNIEDKEQKVKLLGHVEGDVELNEWYHCEYCYCDHCTTVYYCDHYYYQG